MAATDFYYYEPSKGHGLSHNPLNALVAPRPIGWISSRDAQGRVNLAPYSFFNAFNYDPPIIGFSSIAWKDSVQNASETREFVWNLVTRELGDKMNQTSAPHPHGVDEDGVYQTADAYPIMRSGGLNDHVQVTPETVFQINRLAGASSPSSHGTS